MAIISSKSMLKKILDKFIKSNDRQQTLKDISSFELRQKAEGAYDSRSLGIQTVVLGHILGSVGRYQDFDEQFRFKSNHYSERFKSILEAMRNGHPMPPVKLYQIKDEYYVLDGNHRVAAAKQLGHDEILAAVIEFIPSNDTLENLMYRELMDFCDRTGLPRTIKFTEPGQYKYLLAQITEHFEFMQNGNSEECGNIAVPGQNTVDTCLSAEDTGLGPENRPFKGDEVSFKKAARDWYKTIYMPFCAIIERGRLLTTFPDRTISDMYVYISLGHWKKQHRAKYASALEN